MPAMGPPLAQNTSMVPLPGPVNGLISACAAPLIPGLRHDAPLAPLGQTSGGVPGFGILGADLGAELSYGPPPTSSGAADLGLGGLSYGPPPAAGLNHLLGGGNGGVGSVGGLGSAIGYGMPPSTMSTGASSVL